jgi:hypothetical protein
MGKMPLMKSSKMPSKKPSANPTMSSKMQLKKPLKIPAKKPSAKIYHTYQDVIEENIQEATIKEALC